MADIIVRKPKKAKSGKTNRKFGRWSRAPSMKIYMAVGRAEINAKKRKERHLRWQQRKRDQLVRRAAGKKGLHPHQPTV